MGFTAAGISPSTVTTTQQAPLGFVLTVPDGDNGLQEWIYVYNDSGAEVPVAKMATRKAGTATYNVAAAGAINPAQAVGLSVYAIPNGSYGFLLRKGIGTATAAGTVTADKGLILVASGNVTHEGAVTGSACGSTLAGRSGAGTLTVFVNCQG